MTLSPLCPVCRHRPCAPGLSVCRGCLPRACAGVPEEYGHTDTAQPVCPYCGHGMACVADLLTQPGIEQGGGEGLCQRCGRTYGVTLQVVHTFTTRKLGEVRGDE